MATLLGMKAAFRNQSPGARCHTACADTFIASQSLGAKTVLFRPVKFLNQILTISKSSSVITEPQVFIDSCKSQRGIAESTQCLRGFLNRSYKSKFSFFPYNIPK